MGEFFQAGLHHGRKRTWNLLPTIIISAEPFLNDRKLHLVG
jgi:hypothetical protein